jgi:hypothetical protein
VLKNVSHRLSREQVGGVMSIARPVNLHVIPHIVAPVTELESFDTSN